MGIVTGKVEKEDVIDIVCDRCHKTTKDKVISNFEYAELKAHFGYGSKRDGEKHRTIFCESCYDEILEIAKITPVIIDTEAW